MEFPRQESWSGLPFPPPGNLPSPGIEPTSSVSPALQVDSLPAEPSVKNERGVLLVQIMKVSLSCWHDEEAPNEKT